MSAAALQVFDELRAKGFQEARAREIAAQVDNGHEQQAREYAKQAAEQAVARAKEYADRGVAAAKEHADKAVASAVAHSEEKGKATFVSKDQAAQFATRGDISEVRDAIGETNKRIDTLTRFLVWGMIANITVVSVFGGFILHAVGGV